jgi:hypothetical protein
MKIKQEQTIRLTGALINSKDKLQGCSLRTLNAFCNESLGLPNGSLSAHTIRSMAKGVGIKYHSRSIGSSLRRKSPRNAVARLAMVMKRYMEAMESSLGKLDEHSFDSDHELQIIQDVIDEMTGETDEKD